MAEQLLIVKLSAAQLALVGATSAAEFPAKLETFLSSNKQPESSMPDSPDLKAFESRIANLESAVKTIPTEASIGVIVGAAVGTAVPTAMTSWAASADGKKLIGAEASRIAAEALASVGTQPAKPSPAGAEASVKDLLAAGKFEEAHAASPELQAEFSDGKLFAAYHRGVASGKIAKR